MPDFLAFTEGKNELVANGLPATVRFLLSTKAIGGAGGLVVGDTLAGGVGEITGTAYARTSEAEPTPVAGVVSFAQKSWDNGVATDWPASVKSVIAVTTADNSGKALCAWHLVPGGAARDMSAAHTIEQFTPTLTLA